MAAERIIGVDFGTSTSVIRVKRYENGTFLGEKLETKEVTFNSTGITPTLVQLKDEDGSAGYFGYEAQVKHKKYTGFHSFKMDLESTDPAAKARARQLTEEFYGYLAKQYKNQSEGGHLGDYDDRERTIISYPVKWSEETKAFMLETARKAGFPNVTGTDEAQAAIQAVTVMSADHLKKHGLLTAGQTATILLIDMGAGTTDLVLARYTPGENPKTQVLNTWPRGGSIQFGGREIDSLLRGFFRDLLKDEDPDTVEKLLRIPADRFKSWKELNVSPTLLKGEAVRDFEAFDSRLEDEEIDLEYCLDRESFEKYMADYLPQFPALVSGCLEDAGIPGSEVDLVIVTGGHSQWYFVQEMLTGQLSRFGRLPLTRIQENPARIIPISRPQETVALGLAYSGLPVEIKPPSPPVPPVPPVPPIPPAEEDFLLKLAPENKPFTIGDGTVVFGTVQTGCVKVGDTVYVCCGAGHPRRATVKNIALDRESKTVSSAHAGDFIAMQLTGISVKEAGAATHMTDKPGNTPLPPEPFPPAAASVEELVRSFVAAYPSVRLHTFSNPDGASIPKLRAFLCVPAAEQTLIARDCTVFSTGKNGTVITPGGIYICESFRQPGFVSWQRFASGKLMPKQELSTIYLFDDTGAQTAVGYFSGCLMDDVLPFYQALQQHLQQHGIAALSPDTPTPPPKLPGFPAGSVEELVRKFVAGYPGSELQKFSSLEGNSIPKLRALIGVPKEEQTLIAKDSSLFSNGKNGTVITPRGIYICETFGRPYYISWQDFVAGELTLKQELATIYLSDSTGATKAVGYFNQVSQYAFPFYQALQQYLQQHADFEDFIESGINVYTVPMGKSAEDAANTVRNYFVSQNMETQCLQEKDGLLVQARTIGGAWQQLLGLDKAITVRFTPAGVNQVSVEIGGGKWVDKAIGAGVAVATVVLWPLLVTSGLGAIAQQNIIKGAKNVIETYFSY